jgi:pyruvate kinase
MNQNTKIIATLGPSSCTENIIEKLILEGMDVARLNFSHGTYEEHSKKIQILRYLSQKLNKPITILQDLQGPKLRVGNLPPDGIPLNSGQIVHLKRLKNNQFQGSINSKEPIIPLEIPDVTCDLVKGGRILLDDGNLELMIQKVVQDEIDAKVIIGGVLFSHKGVNLPGTSLNIPGFTEKDHADLQFGLSNGIDAIALSFVRSAKDINLIRQSISLLSPENSSIPIIAKLELPEAILNLEQILDAADGVMVARGDLGVETSPSAVPVIQKEIIHEANLKAKFVITATQMLDSMIKNPRPTRAEASDVANAILDGTDAVMLSGETANGIYPIESVAMMKSIIQEAEAHFKEWGHVYTPELQGHMDDPMALSFAVRELAHDREVACIAVFTQTGRSAIYISKMRPEVPILTFTPVQKTYQRLGLYWGIIPYLVPFSVSLEEMIFHVEQAMVSSKSLRPGQKVVIISGFPVNAIRPANLALLHTIGQK